MQYPKNISYENLKRWADNHEQTPEPKPLRTVRASDLRRVAGGLYRIRDEYESVWSLHEADDGRSYIVRADDDSERCLVLADDASESSSRSAYRTLVANQVHVVWECDECEYSNINKEGEKYECGQCHAAYEDVFGRDDTLPAGLTINEATAKYGPKVAALMKRYAVKFIDPELAQMWSQAAQEKKCRSCGHDFMSDGATETCPRCQSSDID